GRARAGPGGPVLGGRTGRDDRAVRVAGVRARHLRTAWPTVADADPRGVRRVGSSPQRVDPPAAGPLVRRRGRDRPGAGRGPPAVAGDPAGRGSPGGGGPFPQRTVERRLAAGPGRERA